MTTSDESWSNRLRQVGDIERPDHYYLTSEHHCVYFGEYTARKGWSHSTTNGIVNNIKKHPQKRGTNEWRHKLAAIEQVGRLIKANMRVESLRNVTFVPAPPSKPPSDPAYDDRMLQIGRAIGSDIDVRPLLETVHARNPAHLSDDRPGPDVLATGIRFCEPQLTQPLSRQIILLDDVLVTGATFVACRQVLLTRFPEAEIFGVFVARRVPERSLPHGDFEDWDL